ncbi:MAG TPA: MarC family protein [Dyella sp.]|uniref:MarC family protein n=1 Tax=Dyella sp. TaxID=1869338 RepID=UPI002CF29D66|nr:MarC family protein [Dyella sp.]HTV87344.1 MarC family protein [Dyella sp.]
MASQLHNFVHLLFIGVVALFPVINPVGTAFVVMPYFAHMDAAGKKRAVRQITLYAFCVCTGTLIGGAWILKLFGLSIPVVRLAGGIMICKMGWEFLSSDKDESADSSNDVGQARQRDIDSQLFYPLTFPLTTGAGTISVLLTLSAHSADADLRQVALNMTAILLAIVAMCVMIYVFYLNTQRIERYLGSQGERIFNRLIAFFIFCVGLQIAVTGLKALFA